MRQTPSLTDAADQVVAVRGEPVEDPLSDAQG
jgi:hypothetical protein